MYNWGYDNRAGRYEKFTQDPYWLVDLMSSYQFSKNLSGQVNMNNLFDQKYYTNGGTFTAYNYGDPRNLTVSARYQF